MKDYINLHAPTCPWHEYSEKFGHGTVNWCEEHLCAWITNPANTWSNLGYILVGILGIYLAKSAKSPKSMQILGLNILFMGLGSFAWHASNIHPTQVMDFLGMYLYTFLILSWNLWRAELASLKSRKVFFISLTIIATLLCYLFYYLKVNMQFIVTVTAIAIILTEILARKKGSIPPKKSYFLLSMLFLAIAQVFSQLDLHRIWCEPTNHVLLQGHALWHIFGSVGVFFSYLHYHQLNLTRKV